MTLDIMSPGVNEMNRTMFGVLGRGVLACCAGLLIASAAYAADDAPAKPKIDCTKPANKNKPACKPQHGAVFSDDEIVNAAYWLARDGKYQDALGLLARAQNHEDPRVLTATGFATRKLGDVDAALPLYARALEIKPDYVQAREYLGEAFLTKGDLVRASEQLQEIEKRCGTACVAYSELKGHIADYTTSQARS
ncbi:MAG: tetratricopeptide repeat protein [Hyphomicrobium sp.]